VLPSTDMSTSLVALAQDASLESMEPISSPVALPASVSSPLSSTVSPLGRASSAETDSVLNTSGTSPSGESEADSAVETAAPRKRFAQEHVDILVSAYTLNAHPAPDNIAALALQLGESVQRVRGWVSLLAAYVRACVCARCFSGGFFFFFLVDASLKTRGKKSNSFACIFQHQRGPRRTAGFKIKKKNLPACFSRSQAAVSSAAAGRSAAAAAAAAAASRLTR
jgi:hypothetical protein